MRPNPALRPIKASDPHWALLYHLKSYIFAFQTQHINRAVHELKTHKNAGPFVYLLSFVPAMLAADAIRMMIQYGPDGPDWDDEFTLDDYVWRATQRSGILGLGEPLVQASNNLNRFGGTGVESLVGPTGQQFIEAGRTLFHGTPSSYKTAVNAMPLNNVYRQLLM